MVCKAIQKPGTHERVLSLSLSLSRRSFTDHLAYGRELWSNLRLFAGYVDKMPYVTRGGTRLSKFRFGQRRGTMVRSKVLIRAETAGRHATTSSSSSSSYSNRTNKITNYEKCRSLALTPLHIEVTSNPKLDRRVHKIVLFSRENT